MKNNMNIILCAVLTANISNFASNRQNPYSPFTPRNLLSAIAKPLARFIGPDSTLLEEHNKEQERKKNLEAYEHAQQTYNEVYEAYHYTTGQNPPLGATIEEMRAEIQACDEAWKKAGEEAQKKRKYDKYDKTSKRFRKVIGYKASPTASLQWMQERIKQADMDFQAQVRPLANAITDKTIALVEETMQAQGRLTNIRNPKTSRIIYKRAVDRIRKEIHSSNTSISCLMSDHNKQQKIAYNTSEYLILPSSSERG